jgi:hypothetical protein
MRGVGQVREPLGESRAARLGSGSRLCNIDQATPRSLRTVMNELSSSPNTPKTIGSFFRAVVSPHVLRICSNCGKTWQVSRYFARRKALSRPSAAMGRGSRGATKMLAAPRYAGRDVANERAVEAELRSSFAHCPACGQKGKFSQRRLWFLRNKRNTD